MINFVEGLKARQAELQRLQEAEVEKIKAANREITAWNEAKAQANANYNVYVGGAAEVALMLDQIEKAEKAGIQPPVESPIRLPPESLASNMAAQPE